jgi:aldehyde:ferredoxin oxidoreductase
MGQNGGDHHEGQGSKALAMTAMADSLCVCSFANFLVFGAKTDQAVIDLINPLCGWNWKTEDYWTAAKRILTVERVYNVREGISSKDDRLPIRMYKDKLPAGPRKDAIFTDEDQKKMEADYYGFVGWDAKGIPTEASLKAYGLEFLIPDLNAAKKKYNI